MAMPLNEVILRPKVVKAWSQFLDDLSLMIVVHPA
jgi:hypothetical protein